MHELKNTDAAESIANALKAYVKADSERRMSMVHFWIEQAHEWSTEATRLQLKLEELQKKAVDGP